MISNAGRFTKGDPRINRTGRPKKFVNARDARLFYRYGIRLVDYNAMYEKQGGVCAICGCSESKQQARTSGGDKTLDSLQVDHDHVTGKVRGLICWKCNVSIVNYLMMILTL